MRRPWLQANSPPTGEPKYMCIWGESPRNPPLRPELGGGAGVSNNWCIIIELWQFEWHAMTDNVCTMTDKWNLTLKLTGHKIGLHHLKFRLFLFTPVDKEMRARGKAFLKELVLHLAQIALQRARSALFWHVWSRLVWHICFQNKTALSHFISCYSLYSAMVWCCVCLSVLETKDPLKEPDHGMFVFSSFDPVITSELEQYPFYFPLKLCVATISQYDNLVKKT